MNICKPPYICQGLWDQFSLEERIKYTGEFYEEQKMERLDMNIISLNDAVDQILTGDPEALEYILNLDPGLSERLIEKLEKIKGHISKDKPKIPDEIWIGFAMKSDMTDWDYSKIMSVSSGPMSSYVKFYSEDYVKNLVKENCLE